MSASAPVTAQCKDPLAIFLPFSILRDLEFRGKATFPLFIPHFSHCIFTFSYPHCFRYNDSETFELRNSS
jgi:hypothetical protein